MFYFEKIMNKSVLKSSIFDEQECFFTTRESVIRSNEEDFLGIAKRNLKDFCEYYRVSKVVSPIQTHSTNVKILVSDINNYDETDGLIIGSDIKDTMVYLNFADCVPLIFYDGRNFAISHAGWRGSAGKIACITVEEMIKEFSSDIKNIKCAIGPAVSMCCYDVHEDVFNKLISTVKNKDKLYEIRGEKIFVDLKNINKRQLTEFGLNPDNIDVCPYCSVCDNDKFFSYRRENKTTNRHSAIVIK